MSGPTRRVPLNTLSENNILLTGVQRVVVKPKATAEKGFKATAPRSKGNFMKPTEAFKYDTTMLIALAVSD